tara:strand:+ start:242 stop:1579 length:1338 start_codon:yes stop_codon:yes gene_type:complete
MKRFNKWLFEDVDNSGIILWRILLGLLLTVEAWGAILTGWLEETYVLPEFRFTFIGFEFLQVLSGEGMYVYNIILGIFGLMIMLGWHYRIGTIGYFIMWAGIYFGQKSHYNNHYYLMLLLIGIMILIPAHRCVSIDAKRNSKLRSISIPRWSYFILQLQFGIVYFYATIAKLYPDWLKAIPVSIWMENKRNYWLVGEFIQQKWLHYFFSYGGIFYDGLIIPLLIFKRTRKIALLLSLFFHLTNSLIFRVGIFPFMAISAILLFWDPEVIRKYIFKKKPTFSPTLKHLNVPKQSKFIVPLFAIYFLWQIYLPWRHYFYEGDVHWTEEGHRLSWQMMTRTKYGTTYFEVIDPDTKKVYREFPKQRLQEHQASSMATKPDMIWQYAQYLKKIYQEEKGIAQPKIYAKSRVSLNGRPKHTFIDPEVDLAAIEKWNRFEHKPWIVLLKEN